MTRLTAADFDQELLILFDAYVHGDLDRRGFLDRASKFAVGGMTAVGLTGIPGMAIVQPMSLIHYVIGLVIAFGAAFAASYLLKYKVE